MHAAVDDEDDRRHQRKLGRNLLIVGLRIFILPFFGLQFSFANALGAGALFVGVASVAAGSYMLGRPGHGAGSTLLPPASNEAQHVPASTPPQPRQRRTQVSVKLGPFVSSFYLLIALAAWFMSDARRQDRRGSRS